MGAAFFIRHRGAEITEGHSVFTISYSLLPHKTHPLPPVQTGGLRALIRVSPLFFNPSFLPNNFSTTPVYFRLTSTSTISITSLTSHYSSV